MAYICEATAWAATATTIQFYVVATLHHYTTAPQLVAHAALVYIALLHSACCPARVPQLHLQPADCCCKLLTTAWWLPSAVSVQIKRVRCSLATCAARFICISALSRALHTFNLPLCLFNSPGCISMLHHWRLQSARFMSANRPCQQCNQFNAFLLLFIAAPLFNAPQPSPLLRFSVLYQLPLRWTLLFYAPHKVRRIYGSAFLLLCVSVVVVFLLFCCLPPHPTYCLCDFCRLSTHIHFLSPFILFFIAVWIVCCAVDLTVCCCSFISVKRCNAVTLTFVFAARVGQHCCNNIQTLCSTYTNVIYLLLYVFLLLLWLLLAMYSCHKHNSH